MLTRKIIPAAALALLVLTGCSSAPPVVAGAPVAEAPAVEAPAAPEPEAPVVEAPVDTDTIYIATLRAMYGPQLAGTTDEYLIDYGHTVCGYFDEGGTLEGYTVLAIESEMDTDLAGGLLGAGITAYCPEHSGVFQ